MATSFGLACQFEGYKCGFFHRSSARAMMPRISSITPKRFVQIGGSFLLGAVLFFALAGWLLLSSQSPLNRASAIEASCEWARLAPFPPSASRPQIEVRGSMFTREFRISFSASPDDVQTWLQNSPGVLDAKVIEGEDGEVIYAIQPGGGAQFAELRLSSDKRTISIRTYWS